MMKTNGSHANIKSSIVKDKNDNKNRIITYSLIGILLSVFTILMVGDITLTHRMPMGTIINGINVSKMTTDETYNKLTESLNDGKRQIIVNNNAYKATDLTLNVNKKSIDSIITDSNWFLKAIPGLHDYTVKYDYDGITVSNLVNSKIPSDELNGKKTVLQPSYNVDNMSIDNGSTGYGADLNDFNKKITTINLNDDKNIINVNMNDNQKPVVISNISELDNMIHSYADDSMNVSFNDKTDNKNIIWTGNLIKTTLMLTYDDNAHKYVIKPDLNKIKDKVNETLNDFSNKMQPDVIMMTPDGKTRIAQIQYGHDGNAADVNIDDVSSNVYKYLTDNADKNISKNADNAKQAAVNAYNVDFNMKAVVKTTETQNAPGDFNSENGSPWIKIDLTAQKAYAYKGSTLVNSFNVATGKAGHRTDNGVFYVNVKYRTQTMRGADYVTPNVPWISYFNGGEGFHGASWNYYNINHGIPSSHGCVNMYVQDAKWIYDFAPIGTKVEVVGSSPSVAR